MIAKVGPKGQIVIPKELRDELGVQPGSTVALRLRDTGTVELRKAWEDPIVDGPAYVQAAIPSGRPARPGSEEVLESRRQDEEIDERQYRRWLRRHSS